jgi:hypothetical protein
MPMSRLGLEFVGYVSLGEKSTSVSGSNPALLVNRGYARQICLNHPMKTGRERAFPVYCGNFLL